MLAVRKQWQRQQYAFSKLIKHYFACRHPHPDTSIFALVLVFTCHTLSEAQHGAWHFDSPPVRWFQVLCEVLSIPLLILRTCISRAAHLVPSRAPTAVSPDLTTMTGIVWRSWTLWQSECPVSTPLMPVYVRISEHNGSLVRIKISTRWYQKLPFQETGAHS